VGASREPVVPSWSLAFRRVVAACVTVLLVGVIGPADARSATVTVKPRVMESRTIAVFTAAPDEINDVHVDWTDRGTVTLTDDSAVLTPGDWCASVDSHAVRCTPALPRFSMIHVDVHLGDLNDRLDVIDHGHRETLYVNGGPGDDVLDARNGGLARIDGGGGTDQLYGSKDDSWLTDGDLDGAGDREGNALNGGPGRDVLVGRGGDDQFGVTTGSWVEVIPFANPDRPVHTTAGDIVHCGTGTDWLWRRRASDFTPANCEWVFVRRREQPYPEPLPTYPTWDPPHLDYLFRCRNAGKATPKCSGTMQLRQRSGTLLADGRIRGRRSRMNVRLHLTPTGRRLATQPRGVLTRVKFHGQNMPPRGWTIRLRLRK
jgi:hypothetical protein